MKATMTTTTTTTTTTTANDNNNNNNRVTKLHTIINDSSNMVFNEEKQ